VAVDTTDRTTEQYSGIGTVSRNGSNDAYRKSAALPFPRPYNFNGNSLRRHVLCWSRRGTTNDSFVRRSERETAKTFWTRRDRIGRTQFVLAALVFCACIAHGNLLHAYAHRSPLKRIRPDLPARRPSMISNSSRRHAKKTKTIGITVDTKQRAYWVYERGVASIAWSGHFIKPFSFSRNCVLNGLPRRLVIVCACVCDRSTAVVPRHVKTTDATDRRRENCADEGKRAKQTRTGGNHAYRLGASHTARKRVFFCPRNVINTITTRVCNFAHAQGVPRRSDASRWLRWLFLPLFFNRIIIISGDSWLGRSHTLLKTKEKEKL